MGHAVDNWSKEYSILAKDNMNFDVLVQLAGIHITLRNISVFGARSNEYSTYKVKDLIATLQDNFYTGLHFDYVFVSGCLENGINLYTYNSKLENCYATNCNVAFYIHGGNGRGTSVHLLMCTAERARTYGYKISQMGYSILQVCAADHCALGTTTMDHNIGDSFGYNYFFDDCRGITAISCANEVGGFSHYINECRGISIRTGRYTNNGLREYADWNDSLSSRMWVINSSRDIEICQTTIASPILEGVGIISIDSSTSNVRIEQGSYFNQKGWYVPVSRKNVMCDNGKVVIE